MTELSQNLTKRIMKRVYAIWFLRQVVPAIVAAPLSLTAALWLTAKEFFVVKIFENFTVSLHSAGAYGALKFTGLALFNTHHKALAVIGLLTGIGLFLAYRLFRNFKELTLVRI